MYDRRVVSNDILSMPDEMKILRFVKKSFGEGEDIRTDGKPLFVSLLGLPLRLELARSVRVAW
jgi:hypothetical protein